MKLIKIANILAIGTPIILLLIGFIDYEYFFNAAISMIFTGATQILLALFLWIKYKNNKLIPFYFLFSIAFFCIFFLFRNFNLEDVFNYPFWILPILLCGFLTYIIYTVDKQE